MPFPAWWICMGQANPTKGSTASLEARTRRTELADQIAAGNVPFDLLLDIASIDPAIARMPLHNAISAYPHWGPTATARFLEPLNIPAKARLSWMLQATRPDIKARIRMQVPLGPGKRPPLPHQWPMFGQTPDWVKEGA